MLNKEEMYQSHQVAKSFHGYLTRIFHFHLTFFSLRAKKTDDASSNWMLIASKNFQDAEICEKTK